MTQPLDLDAIETRANAATPGPWCTDSWEIYQGTEYVPGLSTWIGETCRGTTTPVQDRADAAFVAAARTDVPALTAEVRRLRARTLTESEHNRAWHAIEGAAGEEGADPGTVLNAVLRALGINPPAEESHVRAARYAAAGNEMAASLVRDGFGDDEIAEILARPAAACPPAASNDGQQ